MLLSLIETFPIGSLYELHRNAALRRLLAAMRSACRVLHCIRLGCEGLILGHYLLLDWISQMPRTDILLQVRDGRLIRLYEECLFS